MKISQKYLQKMYNEKLDKLDEAFNKSLTANIKVHREVINVQMFKFIGDMDKVSGVFGNITTGITGGFGVFSGGYSMESAQLSIFDELAKLHDIEKTFNKKASSKINYALQKCRA